MIQPVQLNIKGGYKVQIGLLLAGYLLIAFTGLQAYLKPFSAEFILGALAVISSLTNQVASKQVFRFGIAAMVLVLLYIAVPAKTMLFLSLIMAVLCLAATFHFKSNIITLFSMAMMSPIFDYGASVFSFPVKLFLTSVAARIIGVLQPGIKAEGNFLVSGSFEFSVDTACLGLHMLNTSMMVALILISFFAKKKEKRMTFPGILTCLLIVFLLNIVSNLIRIICLVLWKIPPGAFMHDVVGIVCFSVYVIAPMLYFIPLCLKYLGRNSHTSGSDLVIVPKSHLIINIFLVATLGVAVVLGKNKSLNGELIPMADVNVPGYSTTRLEHRVTKLSSKNALIYIKPIAGFFSSDHQPMICWSGSGYDFTKVHQKEVNGANVYAATLEKGDEHLYTAWWYDNGRSTTISQVQWRWNAFKKSQHYAIINVTASTPGMLEKEVIKMMGLKLGKRTR